MKILNLYAGIGGNRKLWGDDHQITAVEINPDIANIYKDYFPNDKMIIADAHQYLLNNYKEFDFIWSSPPCPTHSRLNSCFALSDSKRAEHVNRKAKYPDMRLYQEIILLKSFGIKKCKWVIENVIPYYNYLIEPSITLSRHPFWCNFYIEIKLNIIYNIVMNDRQGNYYYNQYDFENYHDRPPGEMYYKRSENEYLRLKNEIEKYETNKNT